MTEDNIHFNALRLKLIELASILLLLAVFPFVGAAQIRSVAPPPPPGISIAVEVKPACEMGPNAIAGADVVVATAEIRRDQDGTQYWWHGEEVAAGETGADGIARLRVPQAGNYVVSARSAWYCGIGGCNAFFGQIYIVVRQGSANNFMVYVATAPESILGVCLGLIPGHDKISEENYQKNCRIQDPGWR